VGARNDLTETPQEPGRLMYPPDVIGTSEQIAEALNADADSQAVRELVFAPPFRFEDEDSSSPPRLNA
jgi:hypothetical protein